MLTALDARLVEEGAGEVAGMEHEKGMGWHGLRRKFATELKHTPLNDLCALGGWKSPQTILMCYQQPDAETQRAALEGRQPIASSKRTLKRGLSSTQVRSPATRDLPSGTGAVTRPRPLGP